MNNILDIIGEIIRENYEEIDIKKHENLKLKFIQELEYKNIITNDIDEIFKECESYFIFYKKNDDDSREDICKKILANLESSNISGSSKFNSVNLHIIFNKMKDKISFDEYQKKQRFKSKISKFLKVKIANSHIDININTIFLGSKNEKLFNIKIYDRIRSLENHKRKYLSNVQKEAGLDINGFVFNAKLKDIVNIYNSIGNTLFDKNLRYSLKDELEVDLHIKKTLKENPDEFWYLNNGITMIVQDNDFKLRKSNSIDINYGPNTTISIINGAQTISASASYIYQDYDNRKDIDAKVIFRVIHISKFSKNGNDDANLDKLYRDEMNKISISLNRQKPIKQEDIAYTTSFIDTINQLGEIYDEEYYFKIGKRSKEISEGYDLLEFSKIVKSYLAQKPGEALTKSAKSLLKVNNGKLLDTTIFKEDFEDSDEVDKKFKEYYKPVNFASILMDKYSKYAEGIAELSTNNKENKMSIASYGKLYFIAHIIYVLNNKNDDFSKFDFNIKDTEDKNIKEIIKEYIELFGDFISDIINSTNINMNDFKKDDLYEKFRNYEEDNEIGRKIKEFNEKLHERLI